MKRRWILLLSLVLCLGLAACGEQPNAASLYAVGSSTNFLIYLCLMAGILPLLQIVAGGVLFAAAKHLSERDANQTMVRNFKIIGLTVCAVTIIQWVDTLRVVIPIVWP